MKLPATPFPTDVVDNLPARRTHHQSQEVDESMDETHPFRDREFEIQRLRRREPCFASLWDDFEEVLTILKRLRAKSEPPRPIIEDYVRLLSLIHI